MDYEKYKTNSDFLYKFCPINLYTYRNLINNELWFSLPKTFNDPYDCRFNLQLDELTEDGVQAFYRDKNLTSGELNDRLLLFRQDKNEIVKEIEADYREKIHNEFLVGCFSEKCDNKLMWAHYADGFKGMCLIFERKAHEAFFQGGKVNYSSEIPIVHYGGNGELEATLIFLTKDDIWKYEEEVRSVVKIDGGRNPIKYNPKALKGVIFGYRVNADDKHAIKEIVKRHPEYSEVKFYCAVPHNSNITLEIKEEK